MTFFDACHIDMWGDIVEKGNYIPTNKDRVEIPKSSWNKKQKTRCLLNSIARNFLMSTLTESEYEKVHSCKSSKEIHQYELFKMEDNKTTDLIFSRFKTIINILRSLEKTYDNYDHITKILRSLPKRWRP
ncbi:hypothetical protein CR513_00067, partial [Mucuna pruriens]